jgi:hypothetical protein
MSKFNRLTLASDQKPIHIDYSQLSVVNLQDLSTRLSLVFLSPFRLDLLKFPVSGLYLLHVWSVGDENAPPLFNHGFNICNMALEMVSDLQRNE